MNKEEFVKELSQKLQEKISGEDLEKVFNNKKYIELLIKYLNSNNNQDDL